MSVNAASAPPKKQCRTPSITAHPLLKTGMAGLKADILSHVNHKEKFTRSSPFYMFEPNIFSFHTCYVTDNHSPKDKTVFQLS
ncbi:hypothetical protein LDENG_00214930 [Lucifuga dentata]|nr:hypothetical protein LDENG_00214930 [Lucifuga dentata]